MFDETTNQQVEKHRKEQSVVAVDPDVDVDPNGNGTVVVGFDRHIEVGELNEYEAVGENPCLGNRHK